VTRSDSLDLLRRALAASRASSAGQPTPECITDDTAAALAEGRLDEGTRVAALAHVAGCARCVTMVASLARALADSKVAQEVAAAEGRRKIRLYHIALPAVAAAALLIIVLPRRTPDGGAVHRAPTITATAAPVPMSPMGVVAEPGPLRWASVVGAERYRVTLFDATSRVLYERVLSDTEVVLPDSIHLVSGRSYLWKVDARTGWDRWAASSLVEFRVAGRTR
jgi:anti-sigma factor ChrR (cupin superfamily)